MAWPVSRRFCVGTAIIARSMAALTSGSRFGVLHVEDTDDYDDERRPGRPQKDHGKGNKAAQNAVKKPKKQATDQSDKELQNLAFVKPSTAKGKKQSKKPASEVKANDTQEWHKWQRQDQEAVQAAYEKDLEEALLLSKVESLQLEEQKKALQAGGVDGVETSGKLKSKSTKNAPMSLAEFNKAVELEVSHQQSDRAGGDVSGYPVHAHAAREPPGLEGADFFKKISEAVDFTARKEQIHDEYAKQNAVHSAIAGKYTSVIEEQSKELAKLKTEIKSLQDELHQVKKRNQQLCHVMAAAEMKEKADILEEMEDLKHAKDDLAEQVVALTAALEKEKSAVHALRSEVERRKGKPTKS